jgi:hypothetical protein
MSYADFFQFRAKYFVLNPNSGTTYAGFFQFRAKYFMLNPKLGD